MKIGGVLLISLMLLMPLIFAGAVDYLGGLTKSEVVQYADDVIAVDTGYYKGITYIYKNATGAGFQEGQSYSFDNETYTFTVIVSASADTPSDSYYDYITFVTNIHADNITAKSINKIVLDVEVAGNYTNLKYAVFFLEPGSYDLYFLTKLDVATTAVKDHLVAVNGSKIHFEYSISALEALKIKNTADGWLAFWLYTDANDNQLLNNEVIQFKVTALKSSTMFNYNDVRTWMLTLMGILGWLCAVVATKSVSIIPKRRRRR